MHVCYLSLNVMGSIPAWSTTMSRLWVISVSLYQSIKSTQKTRTRVSIHACVYVIFQSKVNIWNVNCTRATELIFVDITFETRCQYNDAIWPWYNLLKTHVLEKALLYFAVRWLRYRYTKRPHDNKTNNQRIIRLDIKLSFPMALGSLRHNL